MVNEAKNRPRAQGFRVMQTWAEVKAGSARNSSDHLSEENKFFHRYSKRMLQMADALLYNGQNGTRFLHLEDSSMGKNAIVGQSGGPTSVINASLAGVLQACQMRGGKGCI